MDPATAVGGTTISAGLADSQAQLGQALGAVAGFGTDSVAQFAAAYQASGGGPTLALLGFNPFAIIANGEFHTLYWGAVVAFLGIMTVIAFQHVMNGRFAVRGRHPLNGLMQVYFRLCVGVLIIANVPLIYGMLMTVNRVMSDGLQSMAGQPVAGLLQAGGIGTLSLAQARSEAIRQAAARRVIALYPGDASRAEMIQVGLWYNAAAAAVNTARAAAGQSGQLPVLDPSIWNDSSNPDDRVTAYVGRNVVRNFAPLLADLGALPSSGGSLSLAFPSGGSSNLALLSAALAGDDAQAAQALTLPSTPSSDADFEAARQAYSQSVLTDTLAYLDSQFTSVLAGSPTLSDRVKAWFSSAVEQAASVAGGFMAGWREAIEWTARAIGVTLTRMVAFFFSAATGAMIELELFMLVLTMPLWLMPATEDAFHGVLRSLIALTLAAPAYQFIMLFVDSLMALILRCLLMGPLPAGQAGAAATPGNLAYTATAVLTVAGSGGEVLVLTMACYLCAYLFLAIYMAFKTPKLVAAALKGAGAAGMFLSTFATGLAAGAATAVATAAVAAGGPAGLRTVAAFRSAASARGAAATPAVRPAARPPSPAEPATGGSPPSANLPASSPMAARWRETAGFGLRTFIDCLGASSPADGFSTAFKALDVHQRQKEKEAEARHKADVAEAKAAAKADKPVRRR